MTSAQPTPTRPEEAGPAAFYDALAIEHAAIYGYGVVSAHSAPEDNALVAEAIATHRRRREAVIAMLTARSVTPPLPAVGYQLPITVDDPGNAAELAVQIEADAATAWRIALEAVPAGSEGDDDRAFAATALTESAVLTARWRQLLRAWPITEAFPGGTE
jgi:Domain of unknown function (DUF4439)